MRISDWSSYVCFSDLVAEGIAQSKGIDIGIAAARKEGIARRGRIAVAARADREAQYLAEPRTAILRIVAGVARSAAVTDRDIDVALGPIADPAAVVIAVFGLRNAEHRIVGGRGIGLPQRIAAHLNRAVRRSEEHTSELQYLMRI